LSVNLEKIGLFTLAGSLAGCSPNSRTYEAIKVSRA
jgi:hypothetical protein